MFSTLPCLLANLHAKAYMQVCKKGIKQKLKQPLCLTSPIKTVEAEGCHIQILYTLFNMIKKVLL